MLRLIKSDDRAASMPQDRSSGKEHPGKNIEPVKSGGDIQSVLQALDRISEEIQSIRKELTGLTFDTPFFKDLHVNDYVNFGRYKQGCDNTDAAITWKVLDVQGEHALLISRYALDCFPYQKTKESVAWNGSELCKFLNSSFLDLAFSKEEQRMLKPFEDSCKVSILSAEEANKYLDSPQARACFGTIHCLRKAFHFIDSTNVFWFLRSDRESNGKVSAVTPMGDIYSKESADNANIAFRPVIKVRIR